MCNLLIRVTLLALPLGLPAHADTASQGFPGCMSFQGRYLAVMSDVDMVASAYLDGQLGPRAKAMADRLTLIPLDAGLPGTPVAIPVSNSVTAWPSSLDLSRDGRLAYVAETNGPASAAATGFDAMIPSPFVKVVAIEGDLEGRVIQEIEIAGRAQALSLRPQGDFLAVGIAQSEQAHVALLPVLEDGRLGEPLRVSLPDITEGPGDVKWSPDGRLLAATFPGRHEARFYRLDMASNKPSLIPHGVPMTTGRLAGVGHWSPDSRHFFVTNLYWLGGAQDNFVGSNVSTLTAIRVDATDAAKHAVVSAAPSGASAENFAISPDGQSIVTLNMERSFLTPQDPRLSYHSSLTLMTWEPEQEKLVARGTFPFEGILPEGITFDASGDFLAVANFAHFNPGRPIDETSVDIWRLVGGSEPILVKTDVSIPVMRGAHVVKLQH